MTSWVPSSPTSRAAESWREPSTTAVLEVRDGTALSAMLAEHGLSGVPWRHRSHDGYSGARLYHGQAESGRSFMLKHTSLSHDWIMAATADTTGRESRIAASGLFTHGRVRSAAIDGVADGDQFYVLTHDITPFLLTGSLDADSLDAVIGGLVDLHATDATVDSAAWCPVEGRLSLLHRGVDMLSEERDDHGLIRDVRTGWEAFRRIAPPCLSELFSAVWDDFGVLRSGLGMLPAVFLHGDLKLDNLGLDRDQALWLIDWALVTRGPACIDMGWFIAANSHRIGADPQQVLTLYSRRAGLEGEQRRRHESMAALCGLLLRGWRKALDAESGTRLEEFRWWCEQAGGAMRFL